MKLLLRRIALVVALLAAAAVFVAAVWLRAKPRPEQIQGQIEATETNVASKVVGRVAELPAREGAHVERGALLAVLDSPDIRARLAQAEEARAAAAAERDKALRGAREEERRSAENDWRRAVHAAELAETTCGRIRRLQANGVVPRQRLDEAETAARTAKDLENVARARYDQALNGARAEDKAAAAAIERRAAGAVAEISSLVDETRVVAPTAGEVYRKNVELGELVGAGASVVTLVDLGDVWATFNVREDQMARFSMGARLALRIPALSDAAGEFEVYYVAPQGDFATWRTTESQGGFDLKTFEVRARPVRPIAGLRPGMSALLADDAARR